MPNNSIPRFFVSFINVHLRLKTRGHGAISPETTVFFVQLYVVEQVTSCCTAALEVTQAHV